MTGEFERNSRCPLCGGRMKVGEATIPFMFPDTVVLVKDVPAQVCNSCHEPYMTGKVTDRLTNLLNQVRPFHAEVLIISYPDTQPTTVPAREASRDTAAGLYDPEHSPGMLNSRHGAPSTWSMDGKAWRVTLTGPPFGPRFPASSSRSRV